jgi:opacity protein-like surface antigen
MRLLPSSILLLCLLLPSWALASGASLPLYTSGYVDRQSLSLEGARVRPVLATASLGLWLFEGIGGEIEIGTGLKDDSLNNLDFDVSSQLAINLRLESHARNGVAAYAVFGLVQSAFDTRFESIAGSSDSRNFRGVRGVAGLVFPVSARLAIDAAFTRSEYDDNMGVSSFRIGLRYRLNDVKPQQRRGWLR